jgi:naphthoate synthase
VSHDLLLPGYIKSAESKELAKSFAERRPPDPDAFGH